MLTPAQDTEVRKLRNQLAASTHAMITQLRPYRVASERGKKWTVDDYEEVEGVLGPMADELDRMAADMEDFYKRAKPKLGPGDRERAVSISHGMMGSASFAREMTQATMKRMEKKFGPDGGTDFFVHTYANLRTVLRLALGRMFYLTHDSKVYIIRLTKEQAREFWDPKNYLRMLSQLEELAQEKAHAKGQFVEIEVPNEETGEIHIVADACPHPATIRKELAIAGRPERRMYPLMESTPNKAGRSYSANKPKADYDVLLALYETK